MYIFENNLVSLIDFRSIFSHLFTCVLNYYIVHYDSSNKAMTSLIGEALYQEVSESVVEEEEGFVSGLKIPSPWT